MGRRTWIAGLVLFAGLTGQQTATAGQTPGQSIVHVRIIDLAGVPAESLNRARDEAAGVFRLSRIALVWVNAETCQAGCLTVRIVTRPVSAKSRNQHVLGVAPRPKEVRGRSLWIFYPRIRAHSAELGMDASQLLGHVIAHEMGHLLLPYGAHSAAGLMRPIWDLAQVQAAGQGMLTFTPDQAGLIREHLQASASPTARAR
jgi:hypothetical protein